MERLPHGSVTILLLGASLVSAQEYTVHAVEDSTGKDLSGIPVILRYNCGDTLPFHCKWITRKTGKDGLAHFPEAGTLPGIDDIYALTIPYASLGDIQPKSFPASGTMRFKKRSLSERLQWILQGP